MLEAVAEFLEPAGQQTNSPGVTKPSSAARAGRQHPGIPRCGGRAKIAKDKPKPLTGDLVFDLLLHTQVIGHGNDIGVAFCCRAGLEHWVQHGKKVRLAQKTYEASLKKMAVYTWAREAGTFPPPLVSDSDSEPNWQPPPSYSESDDEEELPRVAR